MRIIGGHDRGRRLRAPRGLGTRPTADRVRVTLFDVLGPAIAGARVLDLFAGTGAVGIEALSRGAARVVFVEKDQAALRALRANLAALGASRAAARVMGGDVLHVLADLPAQEEPFDFVFVDPPYATSLAERALVALAAARVCRPGCEVVVQHSTRTTLPSRGGVPGASSRSPFRRHCLDFPESRGIHSRRLEALSASDRRRPPLRCRPARHEPPVAVHLAPDPGRIVHVRAVYPGSFDPLTNGHLDLIERSLRIFDELVVAVVTNPAKTAMFSDDERIDMIRESTRHLREIEIVVFDGLLVDLVLRVGARAVVRGIRAVSDFEYEFQMALMNRKLREEIETVFLMPHEAYSYISSRLIKEVAGYGGSVKGLVPVGVEQRLRDKFKRG